MSDQPYDDRSHAGQVLAEQLRPLVPGASDAVVLALPRGGMAVAAAVADALGAPLDVLVLRRLGLPGRREVPMGAATRVGDAVVVARDEPLCHTARVPDAAFDAAARRAADEVQRQGDGYREGRSGAPVRGRVVVLVDDGLAAAATLAAAADAVRREGAERVVLAAPVGTADALRALAAFVDELVCPWPGGRVGDSYRDVTQPTDERIRTLLAHRHPGDVRAA